MISFNVTAGSSSSGSGIDVTSVVNQILDAERGPETVWKSQQTSLTLQSAALTSINSSLSSLEDKVNALKDLSGVLANKSATSSQTGILTASAQSSAVPGSHTVIVSNLATISSAYTDPVATSSTPLAHGSISIQVGQGQAAQITVDDTNDTLDNLASDINSQNIGVTASVINDASGARLALVSQTSGAPGDLTITGNIAGLNFHKSVTGTNAVLSIDGVPISSVSNTVSNVLPGVTLNLVSASPGTPVQLSVAPDTAGVKQAVNDFVASYNMVINAINAQFTFDPATNTAGSLAGNSSLRFLQTDLLLDVTYSLPGDNTIDSLRSLGVNMADDGTLSVDDAKLTDAVNNHFAEVQNFFQAANSYSFGANFGADLTKLTDTTDGIINVNLAENKSTQAMLTQQINDLEDRLAVQQKTLIAQYSAVDAMLRQFPSIMAQLTSQLGTLDQLYSTTNG
jgi:flagellar hook-associated protein 2